MVSLHNIKEHTSSLQPLISFVTADGTSLPILDVASGTAVCCEVVVKVEEELIPARPDPTPPYRTGELWVRNFRNRTFHAHQSQLVWLPTSMGRSLLQSQKKRHCLPEGTVHVLQQGKEWAEEV